VTSSPDPAPGESVLLELSAALGSGGGPPLGAALDRALEVVTAGEVEPGAVEEVLLQSYLFVGFPGVLEAFSGWRERWPGEPVAAGSADGLEDGSADRDGEGGHASRGRRICRSVYGPAYERLRANVRRLHPDLDRWMIREGYGKVLGRPGLDLAARELCIVALLAAAGRGLQLHSHLRGAFRNGAGAARTRGALDAGLDRVPDLERRRDMEALWERVLRSARRDGDA
jgi:4-carboxymuconolactone decarboxylase